MWLVRRRLAGGIPSKVAERPVNELSTMGQKAHSRALTFLFVAACAFPLEIYTSGALCPFYFVLGNPNSCDRA
jgi:hypothetical protein